MLYTTKGIVIHHFKYSEKSVIAKIYTEKYGLQSFLLNGVRNSKSKNKAAYLQPLSLVEINAFHKEKKGLQQLKNIQLANPYTSIPFNINKTSIAFFLAEILYKSIKEEEPNEALFEFLYHAFQVLDLETSNYANFHLLFLGQLSKFLGFYPQNTAIDYTGNIYFDLQEGFFTHLEPQHKLYTKSPLSNQLINILNTAVSNNKSSLVLDYHSRKTLLNTFLNYYSLHLSNFDNFKSLEILEAVLS